MISRRPARALSAARQIDARRARTAAAPPRGCGHAAAPASASPRSQTPRARPPACLRLRLLDAASRSALRAPDVGAERAQLLLHALVAAVEVVDAQHLGRAARRSGRRAPATPTRAGRSPSPWRPSAWLGAAHDRGAPVDVDVGAHARQLGHVHEAVLEDGLRQHATARCARVISTMNCACMSVGKPGIRLRRDVDRRAARPCRARAGRRPRRTTSTPAARSLAITASRCSGRQSRTSTSPRGDRRRDHERAGLDAVGDDRVLDRLQLVDALDGDHVGAGAAGRARPSC